VSAEAAESALILSLNRTLRRNLIKSGLNHVWSLDEVIALL